MLVSKIDPLLKDASTGFPFETTRRRQPGALPPKMDGWRVLIADRLSIRVCVPPTAQVCMERSGFRLHPTGQLLQLRHHPRSVCVSHNRLQQVVWVQRALFRAVERDRSDACPPPLFLPLALSAHLSTHTCIQTRVDAVIVAADAPPTDGGVEKRGRSSRRVDPVHGLEQPVHHDPAVALRKYIGIRSLPMVAHKKKKNAVAVPNSTTTTAPPSSTRGHDQKQHLANTTRRRRQERVQTTTGAKRTGPADQSGAGAHIGSRSHATKTRRPDQNQTPLQHRHSTCQHVQTAAPATRHGPK